MNYNRNKKNKYAPIIGIIMCVLAILIGLGMGIGWAFIGGLYWGITELTKADPNILVIVLNIAKVMFASLIGVVSFLVLWVPGVVMIND